MDELFHKLPDEVLLSQCEVQVHRAGGPGGQHRNKVETAIRLVHLATHVTAEGKDQRSKLQNLGKALERLREKLERRAYKPKPRKKTQPSKSAVRRRLEGKKHASKKKQARRTDAD